MFKFMKRPIYLDALKNAINAKLTLAQCSEDEKIRIWSYANALYANGGKITNLEAALEKTRNNMQELDAKLSRMSEFELNTLYSMAMIDCGLEPCLVGEHWGVPPRNPFLLNVKMDSVDVSNAAAWFKEKHGITVSMKLG